MLSQVLNAFSRLLQTANRYEIPVLYYQASLHLTSHTFNIHSPCKWVVYNSVMSPDASAVFTIDQLGVWLVYSLKCKKCSTHSMEIDAALTRLQHYPPSGSPVSSATDGCGMSCILRTEVSIESIYLIVHYSAVNNNKLILVLI